MGEAAWGGVGGVDLAKKRIIIVVGFNCPFHTYVLNASSQLMRILSEPVESLRGGA